MKCPLCKKATIEKTYSRQLGVAYAKARDMRAWLGSQPQKALILAYLGETKAESGS